MGDRRIADRRAPEQGVVKISTKNMIIYTIIILVFIILIATNIVLITLYIKSQKDYNFLAESQLSGSNLNITNTTNTTNTSNNSNENKNYSCDININGDNNRIKKGDTVTYEISASNIKAKDGIVIFETLINYDHNIFECKVENSNENWEKTSFIDDYLTMTRSDLTPSADNQVITKVLFKVKEDAPIGEENISFGQINFTLGNNDNFDIDDKTVNIEVIEE